MLRAASKMVSFRPTPADFARLKGKITRLDQTGLVFISHYIILYCWFVCLFSLGIRLLTAFTGQNVAMNGLLRLLGF